jgi:tryptophan synthase alpha chain
MTSRVAAAIDAAHAAGRGAFIGYLPAGFPDVATSVEAAVALAESGADILEIGPPYSDPVMDGPIIQEATQVALTAGFRLRDLFPMVREITRRVDVPVLVMTYWNPVVQYGVDRYADDLLAAGGAGLITPDVTPDTAGEWIAASERTGLDRVFLAAPTSTDERLDLIARSSTGFVYTVSTMGITGERAQLDAAARTLVGRLREHGAERACVGIGISTPEQVAGVLEYADGAIVGTALVRALRDGGIDALTGTARALSAGTALSALRGAETDRL